VLSDNIVIGENGVSFISPSKACTDTLYNSVVFANNTAHSGNYGWIVTGYGQPCTVINGFSAY